MNNDKKLDGVKVIGVFPGSLAEKAGFKPGDLIISANGFPIQTLGDYIDHKDRTTDGFTEFEILRNGQIIKCSIQELTQGSFAKLN